MTALRLPVREVIPPFRSRSLSEATLFRGYLPLEPVVAPCACGLQIVARSDADADVTQAVQAHQRMPEHGLWRLRMGIG